MLLAAAAVPLLGGVAAYFWPAAPLTPAEKLKLALERLDHGRYAAARDLALQLRAIDYRDPGFSGGTEFIIGVATARLAEDLDEASRTPQFVRAIAHLREAERRSVVDERIPEWSYALGVSLHHLGSLPAARPYLETAWRKYAPGKVNAGLLLAEANVATADAASLEKALDVLREILATPELEPAARDRALLQQARALYAMGRREEGEAALALLSDRSDSGQATIVLRAQVMMAERRFTEAIELLRPVAEDRGVERMYPRQANFLIGLCAQELGKRVDALRYFQQTMLTYERTQEAQAAALHAADILRELGRHEEALESYGTALRQIRGADDYRNKWLDIETFRRRVLEAWNGWLDAELFEYSISLADLMFPLFDLGQSRDLSARAHLRWSESIEARFETLTQRERQARAAERQERWRSTGRAYLELAEAMRSSPLYPETIWSSAEAFARGHDFRSARDQYARFLATNPTKMVPLAHVRRGTASMNLGEYAEALADFKLVAEKYPADVASFEARYLAGLCHREQGEDEAAARTWRAILHDRFLTPLAREWQMSLLALARLRYDRLALKQGEIPDAGSGPSATAPRTENGGAGAESGAVPNGAAGSAEAPRKRDDLAEWNDVIRQFEEYLERYPGAADAHLARYLLAKSWQGSAAYFAERVRAAETENARAEFRRKMQERFEQALDQFLRLQNDLKLSATADRLDELGQALLRNSSFEIPNTLYALERYEQAIASYTAAVARHPLQGETLTAYVQMANCYERLGNGSRARSILVQARALIDQIPDAAFASETTTLTRAEWIEWLEWALATKIVVDASGAAPGP